MLKFYYNPLSPNARRVWLTLLEKQIPFEPILLKLDGDQLQPKYLEVNPFHHIPVVVDQGLRIVESLAILDYLEAQYPHPPLLPNTPTILAKVRMVQMLTANELLPHLFPLMYAQANSPQVVQSQEQLAVTLQFLSHLLGESPWFGEDLFSLADIVAGTAIPILHWLNLSLEEYPRLARWYDRLSQRKAWQQTELSAADWEELRRRIETLAKRRIRTLIRSNPTAATIHLSSGELL